MGGTLFLGRHIVEAALQGGHDVTLFNRGRQAPFFSCGRDTLIGDRNDNLVVLMGRKFDAVLDPSVYQASQIGSLLQVLGAPPLHYTPISSISVYRSPVPGVAYDEHAARLHGDVGYGAQKAGADDALLAALSGCSAILCPGLIVGPHDPTERFTYWLRRMDEGGFVLAPGRPERNIQFVDARDLATWCIRLAEERIHGMYNAVGPEVPIGMGEFLEQCRFACGTKVQLQWVADTELLAEGVEPWTEMPLWLAEDNPTHGGIFMADNRRALHAGLTLRPTMQTIQNTLAWACGAGLPPASPLRVGTLSEEKERSILDGNVRSLCGA